MLKKAKQIQTKIKEIKKVKKDIYRLEFFAPFLAKNASAGNFLQVKTDSAILRRPLSIHKIEKTRVFLLFRVRGRGTEELAAKKSGDKLDLIGPLGTGFKLQKGKTILIGGGIGVAPLLFLGQELQRKEKGKNKEKEGKIALLGAANKKEVVCEREFKELGFQVGIATEDGSKGQKGFVTDLLKKQLKAPDSGLKANIYACGPKEMFAEIKKIIKKHKNIKAQVSFEQFMGCGLGVCCACVISTKSGYKKVCQDGPVFDLEAI